MTKRQELAQRRREQGFTQETMALKLGVSPTTYRDWERGIAMPRAGFRPRLARHLNLTLSEVGRLLENDTSRPRVANGLAVPEWLGHLAALEQGAAAIWTFEPVVVPGLLQTDGYASAVERADPEPLSAEDIANRVRARQARQRVLTRQPDPLALSVILDESVLHRVAGDKSVMSGQLSQLLMSAARPTIELRVLPLDSGVFAAAFGAFSVFTSPESTEPYMACVEDRAGPHYLDRAHDVAAHVDLFQHLCDVALCPDETENLIRTIAKERYT
jgi:transcriptional regulator with XRE-family HTH domain